LGFNTRKGHTKTDCTAILICWNRDEMASKGLIKIGQQNSHTAKRKFSMQENPQVNITEEYEWKALV